MGSVHSNRISEGGVPRECQPASAGMVGMDAASMPIAAAAAAGAVGASLPAADGRGAAEAVVAAKRHLAPLAACWTGLAVILILSTGATRWDGLRRVTVNMPRSTSKPQKAAQGLLHAFSRCPQLSQSAAGRRLA